MTIKEFKRKCDGQFVSGVLKMHCVLTHKKCCIEECPFAYWLDTDKEHINDTETQDTDINVRHDLNEALSIINHFIKFSKISDTVESINGTMRRANNLLKRNDK